MEKSYFQLVLEDIEIQVDCAKQSIDRNQPGVARAELNGASMLLEGALRKIAKQTITLSCDLAAKQDKSL